MLDTIEKEVVFEVVEELQDMLTDAGLFHGSWSVLENLVTNDLPGGDLGYVLLQVPSRTHAASIRDILTELKNETPSDPEAEGG